MGGKVHHVVLLWGNKYVPKVWLYEHKSHTQPLVLLVVYVFMSSQISLHICLIFTTGTNPVYTLLPRAIRGKVRVHATLIELGTSNSLFYLLFFLSWPKEETCATVFYNKQSTLCESANDRWIVTVSVIKLC